MTNGGGVKDAGNNMPPMDLNSIVENKLARECLTPMGVTSENVAAAFGVSRWVAVLRGCSSGCVRVCACL